MNTKVLYTVSIQMVLGAKISLSARVFPCSYRGSIGGYCALVRTSHEEELYMSNMYQVACRGKSRRRTHNAIPLLSDYI